MEKQKVQVNPRLIEQYATVLNSARLHAAPIAQLSQTLEISRQDAYAMQEKQLSLRHAQGEKQIGWKMGLTSEAKRKQMNLDSPLYGFLTDQMQVKNNSEFNMAKQIHCKIEPEIAFLMSKDLPSKVSRAQVMESILAVAPAFEILDSRYTEFKYFSMEDVIADNSSSSFFVVGPWEKKFNQFDIKNLKLTMKVDGEIKQHGSTEAISGDPVQSVIELCQLLGERNQKLKAGMIVLAGAATAAEALKAGQTVNLEMEHLQNISVKVISDQKKMDGF
jgi:2-oxo-3-hexenedioate decarboxylase